MFKVFNGAILSILASDKSLKGTNSTEGVETPQTTDRERLAENDLSQRKGNFEWRVND